MIALIQRVSQASVSVDGETVGSIGKGFLVLLGVKNGDGEKQADLLCKKIANLRIFTDENDKMNLSLTQLAEKGETVGVLVVSQFTLCADCKGQNRPSFIGAASPDEADRLYRYVSDTLQTTYGLPVANGVFGAHMKVSLLNDGPVTVILDTDTL